MRQPGKFKVPAGGGIVPHHPVHHGQPPAHRGKPPAKKPPPKPPPSSKTQKKPPSAKAKPAPASKPKKPVPKKPHRKLSPGYDVACCSAQALGTLLGWDWDDVLALYWRTARDPDAGATILDTLTAAGCPACVWPDGVTPGAGTGLILGVVLPEPHAIAVTPDGTWWSWGQPFNPGNWPGLVIEEAWCLR